MRTECQLTKAFLALPPEHSVAMTLAISYFKPLICILLVCTIIMVIFVTLSEISHFHKDVHQQLYIFALDVAEDTIIIDTVNYTHATLTPKPLATMGQGTQVLELTTPHTVKPTSGFSFVSQIPDVPSSYVDRYVRKSADPAGNVAILRRLIFERANKEKTIFLSVFDTAYADMAANLYSTSFLRLNISNYLFVGADQSACATLWDLKLVYGQHRDKVPKAACVTYFTEADGNRSSNWGSDSFKRKTHYKTKVILDALRFSANVVIVDLDIVFFKDPLPYLNCTACDIQIQSDVIEGNSGFYMARATRASIALHEKALAIGSRGNGRRISNQKALAKIITWMKKQRRLMVLTLTKRQFPCGKTFYEERRVMFTDDIACPDCVIVHNNWIVSKAAKIYRFKETGMWMVDNDGYYSDLNRKYLSYENPIDFGPNKTLEQETGSLRAALFVGYLLNRTVILPTFSCHGCGNYGACNNTRRRCTLNAFYNIDAFDGQLSDVYREHEFLRHPAVPDEVRKRQSPVMMVESSVNQAYGLDRRRHRRARSASRIFTPSDSATMSATPDEIMRWFSRLDRYSVLRFRSMYAMFGDGYLLASNKSSRHADNVSVGGFFSEELEGKLTAAFQSADYRQYKR